MSTDRNQTIAAAIKDGRVTAASAGQWARRLDADPRGVSATLTTLEAVPTIAAANIAEVGQDDLEGYVEILATSDGGAAPSAVSEAEMGDLFPGRGGAGGGA
jgi:hypothetical protein